MSQHLGRTCLRNGIVLSLLIILLLCVVDFAFLAVAQSPNVHILDLLCETWEFPEAVVMAYKHGFNATLWSRQFTLSGAKVSMISVCPTEDTVESEIDKAAKNNQDLLLALGPASLTHTLAALPALRRNNLMAFGPLSVMPAARIWDPHLYFLLIGLKFSAHTLLRHAVINLRVRRIGFMYTTNVSIGDDEYEHAVRVMHGMGRKLSGVFRLDGRVPHKADDELFKKKWKAFAATQPQAVIIMGAPNSTTEAFIQQMMKDPRTNSAYLMAPSLLEGMVLRLWEENRAKGVHSFPGQVITTSSYPAPTDTSFKMIKNYRSVMGEYLSKSGQTLYDSAKGIPDGRNGGTAMLAGWVAGQVLSQAISDFNLASGREKLISSMFSQRIYFIDDVAVGTFGGEISERFVRSGAVARCNQGATVAYVGKYLDVTTSVSVPEGDISLPLQTCYGADLALSDPAAVVTVNFTDAGKPGLIIIKGVTEGQKAGLPFGTSEAAHDMTLKVLQAPEDYVTITVQMEQKNSVTNIVTGLLLDSTMDIPKLTFVDPIPAVAQLNKFRRNVIFLSPTIEQQLFVLAEYIASLPDHTVRAIIRSKTGQKQLDVLKKSLLSFGVELTSSILMKPGENVKNVLGTSGITIMIAMRETDVPIFVQHLEQNKNARVVILFAPFVIFYDLFCSAFNGTAAADRFLLITNLPNWADVNPSSTLVRNYHQAIKDPSAWSPLSLQNFIVGRVIRDVVDRLPVVNYSSVTQYFYSSVAVSLDDMSFGPFADSNSVTCTSKSKLDSLACAKNFGATSIKVSSMRSIFDPSVPPVFGPVTPSMEYRVPFGGLTRAQLIGLIVGSVVGASVLIAVLVLLIYCRFCRGNTNAPKNLEDPVTIVFTDIQSSTALWAACPEIMPEAVAMHHRLIRRLIAKHRCYEVKTIGDSFMIACKSASAAVQLVVDLQRTFLQHDWGTSAIDAAYHEFEERQAEEDADYEPPTARLDAAVYRKYWSGLRVRAGVHTGLSDIRHDEVTKRYDYYGSASNTAARTESVAHGGQVLLTRAAYMALSTAERAGIDVTALGPVELRGVPQPVEVYQLNAVPGRAFAKLRLDRVCDELDFDSSTLHGTETSGSMSDTLGEGEDNVLAILQNVFAPFPAHQRLKVLEPICKRWNVDIPKVNNQRDVLAVSRLAHQRLAVKISRVIARRQLVREDLPDAEEILSLTKGNRMQRNSIMTNSFRENLFLPHIASKRSLDNERYGKCTRVSFRLLHDSLDLSPTSSVQIREPSFDDFCGECDDETL